MKRKIGEIISFRFMAIGGMLLDNFEAEGEIISCIASDLYSVKVGDVIVRVSESEIIDGGENE